MTTKRQVQPVLPPRERIIAAAADLFHKQGIRGVGVEAIAEAAGTNKMTLYRHFASKDELIAEWARGIVAQKEALWDELSAKYPHDPEAQLVEWSRRVADKLAELERRGSMLANALAELPDKDHPARRVIQAHKQRELKHIQKLCEEAGFRDPDLAANLFYLLLEGAHSCVQCTGMKRVGEDLVRLVDLMVESNRQAPSR
ncbi:MAG TPA: TetR/AcrR family transcriptional regulator [Gemmatimonadaceae bacterium]|jgi:AcrR family transcriptional regulator|nr:TetR/AcrR family transcriptional regulator [Gemmatimonadaceae bacterium]